MFNIESEEIKKVLVKAYPFLELDWMPVPPDALYYDGTELIGAIKLDSGKWEFYTLTISCDEDYFELRDMYGEYFGEWELSDFTLIAVQSGGILDKDGKSIHIANDIASLKVH